MYKFSALIWILIVCLGEFNKNLIGARKHHHQSPVRRIHRPYEAWRSDGNSDGSGGTLSPWELSLISEILTEFGISACPAIDTSGYDEFKQYLTEIISGAHDSRVLNARFTEVYDGLTYCLENEPLEANKKEYQNQDQDDADGSTQTPEDGEESTSDASDAMSLSEDDKSTLLPGFEEGEASEAPEQEQFDDDVQLDDFSEASSDSSFIDEGLSTLSPPTDSDESSFQETWDESELPEEDSEEIGVLEKASSLALKIYEAVQLLLSWFDEEKGDSGESAEDEDDSLSESGSGEMESVPLYHFRKASPAYLEPMLKSSKAHFSDIFQRSVLIVTNRCRVFQPRDISFIQDATFKILSLVYEDLDNAAVDDEVLNVNEELQSKLRDCSA